MPSPLFPRRTPVGLALAIAGVVCACGARGPLDIIVVEEGARDASVDGRDVEASSDAQDARVDGESDALADVIDAMPDVSMGFDGGPLLNCGSCLVQNCSNQLITCVTSTGCTMALQCVTGMCLQGGTPNFQCIQGCTGGNATTQQQLLGVLGCVIGNCGMQCTGALAGLGGGGGGGAGG